MRIFSLSIFAKNPKSASFVGTISFDWYRLWILNRPNALKIIQRTIFGIRTILTSELEIQYRGRFFNTTLNIWVLDKCSISRPKIILPKFILRPKLRLLPKKPNFTREKNPGPNFPTMPLPIYSLFFQVTFMY